MVFPWDILLCIMAYTSDGDLSRLMKTCRTMYDFGVRDLMKHYEASPICEKSLLSFRLFMFKTAERPHFLLSMRIDSGIRRVSEDTAVGVHVPPSLPRAIPTLVEILRAAYNLRTLYLDCRHDFLDLNTDLRGALASLNSLHDVTFVNVDDVALKVLEQMKSPVQNAKIEYTYEEEVPEGSSALSALSGFTNSLQGLRLCYLSAFRTPLCFPHVHTLEIETNAPTFLLRNLTDAFPNLAHLAMYCGFDERFGLDEGLRQLNEMHPPQRPWNTLESLFCDAELVYNLAIQCHVRRWESASVALSRPKDVALFHKCMRAIRPTALDVSLSSFSRKHRRLSDIFSESELSELFLTLDFDDNGTRRPSEITDSPAVLVCYSILIALRLKRHSNDLILFTGERNLGS